MTCQRNLWLESDSCSTLTIRKTSCWCQWSSHAVDEHHSRAVKFDSPHCFCVESLKLEPGQEQVATSSTRNWNRKSTTKIMWEKNLEIKNISSLIRPPWGENVFLVSSSHLYLSFTSDEILGFHYIKHFHQALQNENIRLCNGQQIVASDLMQWSDSNVQPGSPGSMKTCWIT